MIRNPDLRRLAVFLAPLLTLLAVGCGSSSSSGPNPGGPAAGPALFVDTGAGTDTTLRLQVLAIVAAAADGSTSSDLLGGARTLTVADPRGQSVGLTLAAPPAGTPWSHLQMLLDGGAHRAVRADGSSVALRLPSTSLALPLVGGLPTNGDGRLLELRHATPPSLTAAMDGSLDAVLDLHLEARSDLAVQGLVARVAQVDLAGQTLLATLPDVGDRAVRLQFSGDSRLFDDSGNQLDVTSFLRGCDDSSELRVDGLQSGDDRFHCRSGERQQRGRGGEPKFTGRVADLDQGAHSFTLQAFARRGEDGRDVPFRGDLQVDGSNAVVRRSLGGGAHAAASFADLANGLLVEVEGLLDAGGTMLTAREIDLEDEDGSGASGEIEGAVVAVDLPTSALTIGPRGDDPLLVGGRSVPSALVVVDAATVLYRDGDSGNQHLGLADVRTTDRIWIRGTVRGDGTVDARTVRVRDDRR